MVHGIKKYENRSEDLMKLFKFILRLLTANLSPVWNSRWQMWGTSPAHEKALRYQRSGLWFLSFRRWGWTARADGNPAGLQKSQVTARGLISERTLFSTLSTLTETEHWKHHSLNESPVRTSQRGAPCKSRRRTLNNIYQVASACLCNNKAGCQILRLLNPLNDIHRIN